MISGTSSSTQTQNTTPTPTQSAGLSSLASEDTFLKLFVAQLQHQDPLSPQQQDPTQMVSELAQFSQLEQTVNMGQDVHTIKQDITPATNTTSGSTQSTSKS